jgi:hypothetical protein
MNRYIDSNKAIAIAGRNKPPPQRANSAGTAEKLSSFQSCFFHFSTVTACLCMVMVRVKNEL